MIIRCPECQFERDIDVSRIPDTATVATCPKCGNRFHFRGITESSESVPNSPEPLPTAQEGDDPLPPGAVIPHMEGRTEDRDSDGSADEGEEGHPGQGNESGQRRFGRKKTWFFPFFKSVQVEEGGVGVPWEQPERYGLAGGFYHTMLQVLFRAPEFFGRMGPSLSAVRPAIFYVLLSFLDYAMTLVWSRNSLLDLSQNTADPKIAALADNVIQSLNASVSLSLVMSPFFALLQLLFLSAIYHLMIRLAQPDRADFATVFRVIAYSASPLILCLVPLAGSGVGSLWSVACTFIGCKYALGLTWGRTALALAPLFILGLAVWLFALRAVSMSII